MTTTPAPHRVTATGSIDVQSWIPTKYDTADGPTLNLIDVAESFTGDIAGHGMVRFLQAERPDGSASFCGLERVTGSIGDRAGSFVLQDAGILVDGRVSGAWFVVAGSGTGDLTGLRGEGTFDAVLGASSSFTLDYWFE